MKVEDLRKEYTQAELNESSVKEDPIEQFDHWFQEAVNSQINEPNAMVLATANVAGQPSQRTVLLKAYDQKGFVFYTNYGSRKSKEIQTNPQVSISFPWYDLERQVTVLGKAEKVPKSESLKYFISRPKGSQLGAWVSQQSSVISSRSLLEVKLNEMKSKFKDGEIPLPDFWGGFRILPYSIEFWQGRSNRLHDRIRYKLEGGDWKTERLSP
ncbi:MAG: pyridoxamine 5'-phosphate oxidase [Cyclobacteriaceae bacterium]